MISAFDLKATAWKIDWPGRVSRHDVVYLSPPCDPMQGMPIGNGDIGVLCWCENSKIILAVNKCDLWDDARFGRFHNWDAKEEEHSTTLRHAGRIVIDFKVPVFDPFYLSDFKGRLSLADACLTMLARGPFGMISMRSFLSVNAGVLCCEIETSLQDNVPVEVLVERYGSRAFSHWYSLVNRDARIGLKGTRASSDKEGVYITHKLTSGQFAVGCAAISKEPLKTAYLTEHAHASRIVLSGQNRKTFSLIAAVTLPVARNPVELIKNKLRQSKKTGLSRLFAQHKQWWKSFWLRSLMECGDDYLDNLWHLTMYYAASSQRGNYPGRFINGLWSWNRDVQLWNFYFHWNQQQIYWPLNAAGHHDLVESYLKYRFNALPYGKRDARAFFHSKGAFVSDVCERRGYNSCYNSSPYALNHTPVAEIALDFWRQYRYTGDKEFLKQRAIPYLLEAAYFFESLLTKEKDGLYHARDGTCYEGWIRLHDAITELVYAKILFSTIIQAAAEGDVKEPRIGKWREILEHLAPLPVIRASEQLMKKAKRGWILRRGQFQGANTDSNQILAAGYGIREKQYLMSRVPHDKGTNAKSFLKRSAEIAADPTKLDMTEYCGIFPTAELSVVFPSGLLGLSQKGTALFQTMANTARLYSPDRMGWDPIPIVMARLGCAKETWQILKYFPHWQFYCNGFGHYGPFNGMRTESFQRFYNNLVQDASVSPIQDATLAGDAPASKFSFPAWPFRHMGMEAMSVLACAMNEAFLQSHDGIIRVAPAVSADQNVRFTLHATGGFVVSAEIKNGRPVWIHVKSVLGNPCRIENPWPVACLFQTDGKTVTLREKVIEIPTRKNTGFLLAPNRQFRRSWTVKDIHYPKNENYKAAPVGEAILGLPRMF